MSICIFSALTTESRATQQSLSWQLWSRGIFDNNARLSLNKDELAGVIINPVIEYSTATESAKAHITLNTSAAEYNLSSYNRTSGLLDIGIAGRIDLRSNYSLALNRSKQSTRELDLEETAEFNTKPVWTDTLQGHYQYTLSPKNSVSLRASAQDKGYVSEHFSDYVYFQSTAQWNHAFSTIASSYVNLNYSKYSAEFEFLSDPNNAPPIWARRESEFVTTGGNIGYRDAFSEAWNYDFSGGYSKTKIQQDFSNFIDNQSERIVFNLFSYPALTRDTTNISASLNYSGNMNSFEFTFQRQLQVTANGTQNQSDTVLTKFLKQTSKRSHLALTVSYSEQTTLSDGITGSSNPNRDIGRLEASFNHRFSEHWLFDFSVRIRRQEYAEFERPAAEGFYSAISLRYKPQVHYW